MTSDRLHRRIDHLLKEAYRTVDQRNFVSCFDAVVSSNVALELFDEHNLRTQPMLVVGPRFYQSELKIGAAETADTLHFSSHALKPGKSCQLDIACSKWSVTPFSVS